MGDAVKLLLRTMFTVFDQKPLQARMEPLIRPPTLTGTTPSNMSCPFVEPISKLRVSESRTTFVLEIRFGAWTLICPWALMRVFDKSSVSEERMRTLPGRFVNVPPDTFGGRRATTSMNA